MPLDPETPEVPCSFRNQKKLLGDLVSSPAVSRKSLGSYFVKNIKIENIYNFQNEDNAQKIIYKINERILVVFYIYTLLE